MLNECRYSILKNANDPSIKCNILFWVVCTFLQLSRSLFSFSACSLPTSLPHSLPSPITTASLVPSPPLLPAAAQDVITDAYALPMPLDAPGLPAGSYAHAGIAEAATWLCADLDRTRVLERFFEARPDYTLVCVVCVYVGVGERDGTEGSTCNKNLEFVPSKRY